MFNYFWLKVRALFSMKKDNKMEEQGMYAKGEEKKPLPKPDKEKQPDREEPEIAPVKPEKTPANDASLKKKDRSAPDRNWRPDPKNIPTDFKSFALWLTEQEGGKIHHLNMGAAMELTRLFFKVLNVKGEKLTESAREYMVRQEEKEQAAARAAANRENRLTDPQALPDKGE